MNPLAPRLGSLGVLHSLKPHLAFSCKYPHDNTVTKPLTSWPQINMHQNHYCKHEVTDALLLTVINLINLINFPKLNLTANHNNMLTQIFLISTTKIVVLLLYPCFYEVNYAKLNKMPCNRSSKLLFDVCYLCSLCLKCLHVHINLCG